MPQRRIISPTISPIQQHFVYPLAVGVLGIALTYILIAKPQWVQQENRDKATINELTRALEKLRSDNQAACSRQASRADSSCNKENDRISTLLSTTQVQVKNDQSIILMLTTERDQAKEDVRLQKAKYNEIAVKLANVKILFASRLRGVIMSTPGVEKLSTASKFNMAREIVSSRREALSKIGEIDYILKALQTAMDSVLDELELEMGSKSPDVKKVESLLIMISERQSKIISSIDDQVALLLMKSGCPAQSASNP